MDRRKVLISLCGQNSTELYYFDSRGSRISDSDSKSLYELILTNHVVDNQDLIIEVRPSELTTFASLLEYIYFFNGHISRLVTNVGFVDFTPKKKVLLEEHRSTCERLGIEYEEMIVEKNYELSNGERCNLHSIHYKDSFIELLDRHLSHIPEITFLSTPTNFKNHELWKRIRPKCFFRGIQETNNFLNLVVNRIPRISLINLDDILTFDGVHWDSYNHFEIFKKLNLNERRRYKAKQNI